METVIILVKLLCAHLVSDFILQTDNINKGKHESGVKGLGYQLLHSITHAGIAYLLVADWSCWLIRTTEYVLIGTLASFSIAILTGIAVTRLF